MPEVAEECLHAAERSHFAVDFAERRDVSELAACGVPRILGTHPVADELFDEEAEVQLHFLIEIALGSVRREQVVQPGDESPHAFHSPPRGASARRRVITPAIRSQSAVSLASCFRPRPVIE